MSTTPPTESMPANAEQPTMLEIPVVPMEDITPALGSEPAAVTAPKPAPAHPAASNEAGTLVVTGGSRGIGAAVVRLAAARGYRVIFTYQQARAHAEQLVADLRDSGADIVAVQADVSQEADIARLFTIVDEFGPLTGLVTSAGITGGYARVDSVPQETLRQVFDTNVLGTIFCAQQAVRRMSTANGGRGGAVVTLSSRAAALGGGGEWVHYAASKGAIESFTIGLAREVAAEGIRVNSVAPGLITTEIHAAAGDPDRPQRLRGNVPMQRPGSAEEVATAILWLLSDEAAYVTGSIMPIGGGR